MGTPGWIDLDPEPVPIDDPRVRTATMVADGAWFNSKATIPARRMEDVVRAVLAHVDDLNKTEPFEIRYDPSQSVDNAITEHVDKRYGQ